VSTGELVADDGVAVISQLDTDLLQLLVRCAQRPNLLNHGWLLFLVQRDRRLARHVIHYAVERIPLLHCGSAQIE